MIWRRPFKRNSTRSKLFDDFWYAHAQAYTGRPLSVHSRASGIQSNFHRANRLTGSPLEPVFGPAEGWTRVRGRTARGASERDLVVHVVVLAAGAGHRRPALTRRRRSGRAEIAVIGAGATAACAVEHGQRRIEALQHHLGRITVLPVLVLPFACLQRAFEINLRALLQILLGDLREPFAEDHHAMPLGLFASLAGVLVAPGLRSRYAQIDDRTAVLGAADVRIGAQIADENDLVDAACHDLLRLAIRTCARRLRAACRAQPVKTQTHPRLRQVSDKGAATAWAPNPQDWRQPRWTFSKPRLAVSFLLCSKHFRTGFQLRFRAGWQRLIVLTTFQPASPNGPASFCRAGWVSLPYTSRFTGLSTDPMAERSSNAGRDARQITIRGAREHNLKNIDLAIPRDRLVVFTGLSGSGKSSLAFDTIYAEGQRRYVESLSAYARQFLEMMQKPDVDQIDGLSPAISIEQKTTSKNPRSTVGTVTEIYDYMRLLWARIGVPYSPATGLPIESQTVSQMVDRVLALPEGTRIYVLAPVVRGRKGEYKKELAEFLRKGYQRVKVDGAFYEIGEVKPLDKKFTHDIDVMVDRLVVRSDIGTRLADSLEQCLKLADGLAVVELADTKATGATANRGRNVNAERLIFSEKENVDGRDKPGHDSKKSLAKIHAQLAGPERLIFSEKFACPVSGFTISEIEPRLFSFNNPFGACPECGGLGVEQHIDADLVIPDRDATLRKGAIAPWAKSSSPYYIQTLDALARHYRFTLDTKWRDLPRKTQDAILYGSGEEDIKFVYDDGLRGYTTKKPFEGVITN